MTHKIRTSSWAEVVAFYTGLAQEHPPMQPMLDLARFLARSRYAPSLFAALTNEGLGIGRSADFQPGENELQVRFDPRAQQFTFTHLQRPGESNPWSRECAAGEWHTVLERIFHKRLQWFHEG